MAAARLLSGSVGRCVSQPDEPPSVFAQSMPESESTPWKPALRTVETSACIPIALKPPSDPPLSQIFQLLGCGSLYKSKITSVRPANVVATLCQNAPLWSASGIALVPEASCDPAAFHCRSSSGVMPLLVSNLTMATNALR